MAAAAIGVVVVEWVVVVVVVRWVFGVVVFTVVVLVNVSIVGEVILVG